MKKQNAQYIASLLSKLQLGTILSTEEAKKSLTYILEENTSVSNNLWGSLFSSIQTRGPQLDEMTGFINAVAEFDNKVVLNNENKLDLELNKKVVAITGSGKDTWKTFNISTAASFVAACFDICVIKPGSSATSAITGATQVLKGCILFCRMKLCRFIFLLNRHDFVF